MPLYLVQCRKCGHKFEKLTSFSKVGQIVCEKCGGEVDRVYDGAGVFGGPAVQEAPAAAPCAGGCPGCPHAQR